MSRISVFALLATLAGTVGNAQQCQPTAGLFITTQLFNANPTFTASPYTVNKTATSVQVSQGGAVIYTHPIQTGYTSTYTFYGTNNRYFLTRDVQSTSTDVNYRLGLVNLAASPSPAEYSLLNQFYFASPSPDLNVQPSQGNGQAVFVHVGVSPEVRNLTIFCSENGMAFCGTSPFTPTGQVIGEATTTTVRIKEGGAIRAECLFPAPTIAVSPASLDFANVTEGASGSRTVTIQNSGNAPLTFSSIVSNPLFSNTPTSGTIAATSSGVITVALAPPIGTAPGVKTGQLTLNHNDPAKPPQVVNLTGTVVAAQPQVAVSVTSLAFGSVVEGFSATRTFSIQNAGAATLTFTVASSNAMFTANPASGSVTTGNSRTVTVTFAPSAGTPPGTQNGQLTVTHNDPTQGPRQIALSGAVQAAIAEACYSATTVSFGSVNAGSNAPRTVSLNNCGTAQLSIQTTSLTSGTPSVWTYSPAVPPVIAVPIGGIRTFSVTLSVPGTLTADIAYYGELQVTTSDGVNPQPQAIALVGTGHVPIARIEIPVAYWDIDYRETEIGFEFSRPLLVRNTGDRALTMDVVHVDPLDPDQAEFALETDAGTFTVPASGEVTFRQTFAPSSPGWKDLVLRVQNTNDPTFTSQDILLHGTGTPPVPLDAALVLDRSGSMSEAAGEVVKIAALQNAASLFAQLLRDNVDYLGITRYNQASSNILPLGPVAAVRADALSVIAGLTPSGRTGIGGALRTASGQFDLSPVVTPPDPAHRQAMVVLTDGKENEDPRIQDVLNGYGSYQGLFAERPDLLTYSVGLGLAGNINADRLQELTNRGAGGFYLVTGNLEGLSRFNLENFFFKIFSDAVGNSMVVDPTYSVGANEVREIPVPVITDDRRLLLLFVGEDTVSSYVLELVDPRGRAIAGSGVIGPATVRAEQQRNWAFYRVELPGPSFATDYAGTWTLRVRLRSVAAADSLSQTIRKPSGPRQSRFSVNASVASNYRLVTTLPELVQIGEPMQIRGTLARGGWPSPRGRVSATVVDPRGSVRSIELFDDGLHGDDARADGTFAASYGFTSARGSYSISVNASGVTERGERTKREASVTQFVGAPAVDPAKGRCISCLVARFWLIVTVLASFVALLLLAWAFKHRRRLAFLKGAP